MTAPREKSSHCVWSGFGKYHTNNAQASNPQPLVFIGLADIRTMVDKPQRKPKDTAQWLTPSELESRLLDEQEANGRFMFLWADPDKEPLQVGQVFSALKLIIAGRDCEVYNSRSATPETPKSRIIIPIEFVLTAEQWVLCQMVLNDKLLAAGITPDPANLAVNQVFYLPNQGKMYHHRSVRSGVFFDPLTEWAEEIEKVRVKLAEQAAALEAEKEAARRRREAHKAAKGTSGRPTTIDAFSEGYTPQELMVLKEYDQRGNTFRHPASESGSYSATVRIADDGKLRVNALSPNDPLYTGGGAHDAFSVFRVLFHDGKEDAALKDAGDKWLTIGNESWNKVVRREYMEAQAAANPPKFDSIDPDTGEVLVHPLARFIDCDLEPRPQRWLIPGFIGHGLVIFAGAHGAGKTTTILPLAMTAAGLHHQGDQLAPTHWRHVIYIMEDVEQGKRIMAGIVRWGNMGLDPAVVRERLHIVEARRLGPLVVAQVGETYCARFTRIVEGVHLLPLVVIDTKAAVLELENENDNSQASKAMAALKQGFEGLPVWLIGHVAKANLTRADIAGLSLRGASAFEADANQVIYLTLENGLRHLARGKTRFEARWEALEIRTHCAETLAADEFGDMEVVSMRWNTAHAPQQTRREAVEQAKERAQTDDAALLRDEVREVVQTACELGNPLNRAGVRAKIKRKATEVINTIENLLSEQWLYEVVVPPSERTYPRRSMFLVNFSTEEHDAILSGSPIPEGKLQIPPTWKKAAIPIVPGSERLGTHLAIVGCT